MTRITKNLICDARNKKHILGLNKYRRILDNDVSTIGFILEKSHH